MQTQEERFLSLAIEAARESVRRGDEPFGAVLVRDGAVVATGCNGIYTRGDRTAHAELTLVQEYCRSAGVTDLSAYTLYSSCEPCYMCSGALVWAKPGAWSTARVMRTWARSWAARAARPARRSLRSRPLRRA